MAKSSKALSLPSDGKTPRAADLNVEELKPIWSFKIMDTDGPFSWRRLYGKNVGLVLDRLKHLETMSWAEITGEDNHFIGRDRCSQGARDRLNEIHLEDIDSIYSLHVTGRQRVIGIRDRHILQILWYDPEHQVCPSKKKHT